MCSGTYLCQQSHIQPQQCCQPHSSPPHPLHKTSAPNSIGLRQRGERSCRSSHRSSSVLTLLSYYVGGGREAEGCRESLRTNILVLTSTCNSWVLNPFKSLARKSSGRGGGVRAAAQGTEGDDTWQNVFTRLSAFALHMAYCEKTRYVEISNSLQLP